MLFLMTKYKHYAISLICYWSCSTIKENINKEKSFGWIKLPFCKRQLPFHCCTFRKAYFTSAFFSFAGANYLFADVNREQSSSSYVLLISCDLVVWRIAQIRNKKDLCFWAGASKTGSALVASACWMLTKSIFYAANEKKGEAVHKFLT